MWGILARAIYYTNRQFSTKEELKAALIECWELECNYPTVPFEPTRFDAKKSGKGDFRTWI
jgi:hypothetical protein